MVNASRRSRWALVLVVVVAGAALYWGKGLIGLADGQTDRKEITTAAIDRRSDDARGAAAEQSVDLSEKQTEGLKIGKVATHEFAIQKTAVGTIDFNENMSVQVFSQ